MKCCDCYFKGSKETCYMERRFYPKYIHLFHSFSFIFSLDFFFRYLHSLVQPCSFPFLLGKLNFEYHQWDEAEQSRGKKEERDENKISRQVLKNEDIFNDRKSRGVDDDKREGEDAPATAICNRRAFVRSQMDWEREEAKPQQRN